MRCGRMAGQVVISIHALLAESDGVHYDNYNLHCVISIHALLAESDAVTLCIAKQCRNFYPRSPCGERPWQRGSRITYVEFLSTLSLRRATAKVHKTVGHFCAYETNFMEIASSC